MALFDSPLVLRLEDGRLQLRHGPIDLIIEAFGLPLEVAAAYQQATDAFATVLTDLVAELDNLRKQQGICPDVFHGKIAGEMADVARLFSSQHFVTPMIAVAGAVADHVLHAMTQGRVLSKAYVNNGGDIALHLGCNQSFTIGICSNPAVANLHNSAIVSKASVTSDTGVGGIATSGWRGRSHSLGIADSVTVLARTAAIADGAATLIANAIDLPDHPSIERQAAAILNPDSDLGNMMVTVDVKELSSEEVRRALNGGQELARSMIDAGQIIAVYGSLNSQVFSLNPINFDQTRQSPSVDHLKKEIACA